ncbi:MAG: 1-(5-phosphoribosyl)-5-[(5-phosphoribosylamino)methylideneamino]imidazole-4-carboxamide isomerase [Planctomycetota bacterium]
MTATANTSIADRPALTLYPAIDLRGGKVIRLVQGDYERQIDYADDPIAVAQSFAHAGAQWLHVVDLDGAKAGKVSQLDVIRRIADASGLRVQAGGGVRSTADVDALLDAGVTRVVVGTKAIRDWPWFEALMARTDMPQRLTLAIDAKNGQVATAAWTHTETVTAQEIANRTTGTGLGALLYTDVARDGMLSGIDFAGTSALADTTDTPVIASGGVANISDLQLIRPSAIKGVIIGRALYDDRFSLAEALQVCR